MTRAGRPLRFLGTTLAGWTALRIVMLWPAAPTASSVKRTVVPRLSAVPVVLSITERSRSRRASQATVMVRLPVKRLPNILGRDRHVALALAAPIRFDEPQIAIGPPGEMIAPLSPTSTQRRAKRWSADFWLVVRGGSNRQTGFGGGELGGAQAGARFAYALDRNRRLAAFARVDTPLSGMGREAALGFDWRPTSLPVRIVGEERMPLDGGKPAPAAGLVGGFGPVLRHGFRLEGYGQAGIIARRGGEGFADGAVRATKPIGTLANLAFDLGAGAWGGAQREAARLDIGPTLGASVPIGEHAIRIALDWRERVAGMARPGSGPALTIGASF